MCDGFASFAAATVSDKKNCFEKLLSDKYRNRGDGEVEVAELNTGMHCLTWLPIIIALQS